MEYVLAINPGSTSTKVAIFEDHKKLFAKNLEHTAEELAPFEWLSDQVEYRKGQIDAWIQAEGFDKKKLTLIMSRGGFLPSPHGALLINKPMVDYLLTIKQGEHASNIAPAIADCFAKELQLQAYVYDAVMANEIPDYALITGIPEITKEGRAHVLNVRAMARRCAEQKLHKPFETCTFIVNHEGGGGSVSLVKGGVIVDIVGDDEGGICVERSGRMQALLMVRICYSGKYSFTEMAKKVRGNAGLKAHLGTDDMRKIEKMVLDGDAHAIKVCKAYALSKAKAICELAAVAKGDVDCIILTGGVANSKLFMGWIKEYIEWVAPVEIMPGELEMEALAEGGLRVLRGEEGYRFLVQERDHIRLNQEGEKPDMIR